MTDPIQTLRQYVTGDLDVIADLDETEHATAALTQVENLVRAAHGISFAIWEDDAEEAAAAKTFRDALAPFKDTP